MHMQLYSVYIDRERSPEHCHAGPQVFPDANHAAMPSLELRISPGMEGRVFQYGNGSKPWYDMKTAGNRIFIPPE